MSHLSTNKRNPVFLRISSTILTLLALLSFALGSLLLILIWFGVGVTTAPGKEIGAAMEGRAFAWIILWPATMLAVWVLSTLALLLAKRWLLASLSLPVAFAILYAVWMFVAFFMLNISGVMFAALFILLNTGAIWLTSWYLKSISRSTLSSKRVPAVGL